MITYTQERSMVDGKASFSTNYTGLSTDARPAGAKNGDTFFEMDTGEVYMYDGGSSDWVKL